MVIDRLPQHGALYLTSANGTRGARVTQPFTMSSHVASMQLVSQYAEGVSAVSSFWTGGRASFHPGQALGPQDVFVYGDSALAWCAHFSLPRIQHHARGQELVMRRVHGRVQVSVASHGQLHGRGQRS
jgi:hypothetical protein